MFLMCNYVKKLSARNDHHCTDIASVELDIDKNPEAISTKLQFKWYVTIFIERFLNFIYVQSLATRTIERTLKYVANSGCVNQKAIKRHNSAGADSTLA